MEERLHKILANHGVASRREAEKLIAEGCVTVNGERITAMGTKADPERDHIKVNGKSLKAAPPPAYWLLYKPKGIVSTRDDPQGRPTVMDLLPGLAKGLNLYPAGRLDFMTEGLLVLTNDGDFANILTHPSHGCAKTYHAKVSGVPGEAPLERLRRGFILEGKRTRPAEAELVRATRDDAGDPHNGWVRITLREGRQNQVRKMLEHVGHPVLKLKRVAIGPLLAGSMQPGESRPLTEAEVAALRRAGDSAGPRLPATRRERSRPSAPESGSESSRAKAREEFEAGRDRGGRPRAPRPAGSRPAFAGQRPARASAGRPEKPARGDFEARPPRSARTASDPRQRPERGGFGARHAPSGDGRPGRPGAPDRAGRPEWTGEGKGGAQPNRPGRPGARPERPAPQGARPEQGDRPGGDSRPGRPAARPSGPTRPGGPRVPRPGGPRSRPPKAGRHDAPRPAGGRPEVKGGRPSAKGGRPNSKGGRPIAKGGRSGTPRRRP